jgi:hypothetical protein
MNVQRKEPTKRPRLWVPGTLVVTGEGELVAGAHAGFNGYGKDFAASICGHAGSMRDWRHRAWMVKRSDLDDNALQQHAIILPETLLDPEQQPFALKWLAVAVLNHLFAQVNRRAHQRRRDAEQIARTISQVADPDTTLGEIPVYERARKVPLEAIQIPMPPGAYVQAGEANNALVLPARARRFVDRVAMWRPSSRRGRTPAIERVASEEAWC